MSGLFLWGFGLGGSWESAVLGGPPADPDDQGGFRSCATEEENEGGMSICSVRSMWKKIFIFKYHCLKVRKEKSTPNHLLSHLKFLLFYKNDLPCVFNELKSTL